MGQPPRGGADAAEGGGLADGPYTGMSKVMGHPVGQLLDGQGLGHMAGKADMVKGQPLGQAGGWQGCGHICCGRAAPKQEDGQDGGRHGLEQIGVGGIIVIPVVCGQPMGQPEGGHIDGQKGGCIGIGMGAII